MKAADDPLVAAARQRRRRGHAGREVPRPASSSRCARPWRRTSRWCATPSRTSKPRKQVFLDAEHFFDGYRANRDYALEVLRTAAEVRSRVAALCDTNGGMLPGWVADVVDDVIQTTGVRVGIHCHNDTGCAVANTLAAVDAGATHVQGTLNGYGERTGNADLVSVVANLELKLGRQVLPPGHLREATRIAHAVAEVTNFRRPPASPTSGQRLRAQGRAARQRDQGRPEPVPAHGPDARGQRHAPAGLGHGRARQHRAEGRELGFDLSEDKDLVTRITNRVKDLESRGHLRGGRRVLRAAAHRESRGRGRRTSRSSRGA